MNLLRRSFFVSKRVLTNFQVALSEVTKVRSAHELAERSEISQGALSQYKSGAAKPKVQSLAQLMKGLSDKPKLAEVLLRAHLLDECPPEFRETFKSIIHGKCLVDFDHADVDQAHDAELERAISVYRQAALVDPKIREIIVEIAKRLL